MKLIDDQLLNGMAEEVIFFKNNHGGTMGNNSHHA